MKKRTSNSISIAVLARKAELGKGKTRLAATMGEAGALEVYRQLIAVCAHQLAATSLPASIYFTPSIGDTEIWPAERFRYFLQPSGEDLGGRLRYVAAEQLNQYRGVLLMGTDCPYLSTEMLEKAAILLDTHDAVLGPASDGGYYLLGLRCLPEGFFDDMIWSDASVARATRIRIAEAGMTIAELPPLDDIDTENDWRKFCASNPAAPGATLPPNI